MVDILLRNIPADIERAIKARAKESGLSISEVAQSLLRKSLAQPAPRRNLTEDIRSLLGPDDFIDLDIPREINDRPPPDFS